MAVQLSAGAIESFSQGLKFQNGESPVVLQILNHKKMPAPSGSGPERLRVLISDGVHTFNSAMLSPTLSTRPDLLENNVVFSSSKYNINTIAGGDKKIVMFMEANLVRAGMDSERIGHPTTYTKPLVDNTPSVKTSGYSGAPVSPQQENHGPSGGGRVFNANPTTPLANRTSTLHLNSPVSTRSPGGSTHPIVGINPYQNRWVIKARVMMKGPLKQYNNAKGPGKLFNFEVADNSGVIRITGFNDQVDKFFDLIEPQKVYLITGCSVKSANKQFNKTGHDYELTLTSGTLIELVTDDGEAPKMSYDFVPLEKLHECTNNSIADVIGIVYSYDDVSEITARQTQKTFLKRELTLVDSSQKSVRVTLWGEEAEKFAGDDHPIMAIKSAVVKEFGGRSLSMGGSSSFILNPDIQEAHFLRGWYEQVGSNLNPDSLSNQMSGGFGASQMISIADARDQKLGMSGDKADYYTTKATVIYFKKDGNVLYPGCKNCKKKLIDEGNGYYRCEKCATSSTEMDWRAILSANIADYSDNLWVTLFNEQAEQVLDVTVKDLGDLKQQSGGDEQSQSEYDTVFSNANFKSYLFKIRVKLESYNDETRLKSTIASINKITPVEHGHRLLQEIDKLSSK